MRPLLYELRWRYQVPLLPGHNTNSIYLTEKPGNQRVTNYNRNHYYLLRHFVEEGKLRTQHVRRNGMAADAMTKPLNQDDICKFRDDMQVVRAADDAASRQHTAAPLSDMIMSLSGASRRETHSRTNHQRVNTGQDRDERT